MSSYLTTQTTMKWDNCYGMRGHHTLTLQFVISLIHHALQERFVCLEIRLSGRVVLRYFPIRKKLRNVYCCMVQQKRTDRTDRNTSSYHITYRILQIEHRCIPIIT